MDWPNVPRSNHLARTSTILAMIMQARSHNLGRIFLYFLLILQDVHAKCPFSCNILQENSENLACKTCKIFISCKNSCKILIILQEILQDIKISHLARNLYPAEYLAVQSCKMLLLEDMSIVTLFCQSYEKLEVTV